MRIVIGGGGGGGVLIGSVGTCCSAVAWWVLVKPVGHVGLVGPSSTCVACWAGGAL